MVRDKFNYKLNRRNFLKSVLIFPFLFFEKETFSNENDILVSSKYKVFKILKDLNNPGELSFNKKTSTLIYSCKEKNEKIFFYSSKDHKFLDSKINLGKSVYQTLISSNLNGEVFIYQSNGLNDNFRVFSEDYTLKYEYDNLFVSIDKIERLKDMATSLKDNNLYMAVWGSGRIDCFDKGNGKIKKKIDCDWSVENICIDRDNNIYFSNFKSPLDISPPRIKYLSLDDKFSRKKEIILRNPYEKYGEEYRNLNFFIKKMSVDHENKLLLLCSLENNTLDYKSDVLLLQDPKSQTLETILALESKKCIKGIASVDNFVFLSISNNSLIDNKGEIIMLEKIKN